MTVMTDLSVLVDRGSIHGKPFIGKVTMSRKDSRSEPISLITLFKLGRAADNGGLACLPIHPYFGRFIRRAYPVVVTMSTARI